MRAWKRLRTSSEGDADVMLCLEYVDEVSARDIARELVGTEDLDRRDDSDIWAHRVNGAKYARVRGRRTMSLGGTVHEKMTVARDDFPRSVRRTMEAVSRGRARALDGETRVVTRRRETRDRDASVDAESRARERVRTHGWNHGARGRSAVSRLRGDFIARRDLRDGVGAERRAADDTDARAATTTAPESSSSSSFEVFLPHRSLLVFTGEAYRAYVHGIARRRRRRA